MVFNKDILRLSFNVHLDIIASSEESGETRIPVTCGYQYTGPACTIAINPRFMIDALSMADNVLFAMDPTNTTHKPVYITDGSREAVIMPMNLE
jgi:DNA polymerase III sliding clamp (beta) subunit (PCNA family)